MGYEVGFAGPGSFKWIQGIGLKHGKTTGDSHLHQVVSQYMGSSVEISGRGYRAATRTIMGCGENTNSGADLRHLLRVESHDTSLEQPKTSPSLGCSGNCGGCSRKVRCPMTREHFLKRM
eukprot:CAMPEP_0184684380 /NCGR_PEP_ID=MMETSP0312-20130426/15120_1 /TAXON_ID=31354 /ORGANISM="Compsopogon coeruleus, Strain SAG 36.94" /LENGTH=119 /DNA_ID=CAMNT_0027137509 /DNA_START=246 /DNA_END=605 /DNA_ORIENTATION=-